MEHVIDQALADLASDREQAGRRVVLRTIVTVHGVARLALALLASMVVLSHHWRKGRAGRALIQGKEVVEWIVLVTLLVVFYDALSRPEYSRLWTLSPEHVVRTHVPLALPAAVLAFVLRLQRPRVGLALALGTAMLLVSIVLTDGVHRFLSPRWSIEAATKQASLGGRQVDLSREPVEYERVRQFVEEWQRQQRHSSAVRHLPLAAFCLLFSMLGVAVRQVWSRPVHVVVASRSACSHRGLSSSGTTRCRLSTHRSLNPSARPGWHTPAWAQRC